MNINSHKQKGKKRFENVLKWNYAVTSLLIMTILSVGIWNIPTVKAAISETIQKAINLIISGNFSDIQNNLNKMPPNLAFMGIEISHDGRKLTKKVLLTNELNHLTAHYKEHTTYLMEQKEQLERKILYLNEYNQNLNHFEQKPNTFELIDNIT